MKLVSSLITLALCLCSNIGTAQEIAIGIFGEFTSWKQMHMAVVAAFDLDVRKNFEASIAQRFGAPILSIPDLHPQVANVKVRMGTSHSRPDVGVGTALDMIFGTDGETPVVALIGGSSSSNTIPVASVAAVLKIPQISFSATSPALSDKQLYPYFRTVPPDSIQGKAFWQWIVNFDIPRVVCLYGQEPYGEGLYLAMKKEADDASQSSRLTGVPMRYMPVNWVEEEARAAVLQVKAAGTPFVFLSMNSDRLEFLTTMEEEGLLGPEWQIVASESWPLLLTLPNGFMKWNPVSLGAKYPQFQDLWGKMTADDVVGVAARDRYKLNNFRVPIENASVPPVTDAAFQNLEIPDYSTFLFDACYTLIFSINALLQSGRAVNEIKGEILLEQVKLSRFEGISGQVGFDEYGDRQAAYELWNYQPDAWKIIGIFSAADSQMTLQLNPYWMFGVSSLLPPVEKTSCGAGYYKDNARCLACPRGFYCPQLGSSPQQCSRGEFANETGSSSCLPCASGTFAAEQGSTRCTVCPTGFFGASPGLEACTKCPKGQYMSSYGAVECISCGKGMVTLESGAQSVSECLCAEGFFMCNNSLLCQSCPEGLWCEAGLDMPVHRPGFWTPMTENPSCTFQVFRCRSISECPGFASLGSCAEGREGIACNNCKLNHFPREDGTCARCGPEDYVPSILSVVGGLIVVATLVNCIKVDLNQQSLNLLTVAAVGGQMVMALQTLGSVRQLSIDWVDPVGYLIEFTNILTFDLDLIKISCLYGRDSPTLKFVCRLLVCPLGITFFILCWLLSGLRGRRLSLDATFNLSGILVFALFISLTLVVLDPLQCQSNPSGSYSMVSSPGILCFESGEHIGLVILAIVGIICYPVSILSWATYTTLCYPARVASGRGLQLVHRHRFLFQRFKSERYYYGALLLWRNSLVAVFPVLFYSVPEIQMELMGGLLILSGVLQIRLWPWRTDLANYIDLVITSILQVVLLGVAPMLKLDESTSVQVLGWILAVAVVSPLLAGLTAIAYSLLRHYRPAKYFGIFLCHHKGGAGSLCRLLKLLVAKHSNTEVFLDSDQLEDLDLIFDTIRLKTKSVVVVLTAELLKRMWCAGEIVTAFKNKVCTVPLICDDYEPLDELALEQIPDVWTAQQKQILAYHGIAMEDVQTAYRWLDDLEHLTIHRFASTQHHEEVAVEMLQRTAVGMKLFRPEIGKKGKVKARILITGSVSDPEALATLEVFHHLVQTGLQKECVVVRSASEVMAYRPWAYYFVVLFSRGILRDTSFAQLLLSMYVDVEDSVSRPLEIVTVNADTGFEFPSPEFLTELEENGLGKIGPHLGEPLAKAYRSLLNVLALPLSPMGSEGLLEKQVSEICRRFRRYQNSVFALALDDEDDQKVAGDGADPSDIFASPKDADDVFDGLGESGSFRRIGKSVAWTAAGALIDLTEEDWDPSGRERAGSVESVASLPSTARSDGQLPLVLEYLGYGEVEGRLVKEGF